MAGLRADQIANINKDMYKYQRIGETLKEAMYPKIYKVVQGATGAGDKFTQKLSAGSLARHEVEGQVIKFNSPLQGWTSQVAYQMYSDGLNFSYESVEDSIKTANMVRDFANTWGDEVFIAKETLAARGFNEGGTLAGDWVFDGSFEGNADASGLLLYDSKPLFNLVGNLSKTKGGGTYYNSVANAYSTGAISASHFSTLWNLMTGTNNRDEQDRPTRNLPDTVLCKPADYDSVWTVLESDQLAGSPNNDKNVQKGRIKNIISWDFLDDDAFYVGKSQSALMTFEERSKPSIMFFDNPQTRGYLASIVVRFGVHFKPGCRRLWVRGGGTSA